MKIKTKLTIKRIRNRNEETAYTIADVVLDKNTPPYMIQSSSPVIVGIIPIIMVDDDFLIEGQWIKNNIFGWQIQLETIERVAPASNKGLVTFLQNHCKGLGKKLATEIVKIYGDKTLDVILDTENTDYIVGLNKAKRLAETVIQHKNFESTVIELMTQGLSFSQSLKLYNEHNINSIKLVKEKPFKVLSYDLADTLSFKNNYPFNSSDRIKGQIIHILQKSSEQIGATYIPKNSLYEMIHTLNKRKPYQVNEIVEHTLFEEVLQSLLNEKEVMIDYKTQTIQLTVYFNIEKNVPSLIYDIKNSYFRDTISTVESLKDKVDKYPISLTERQKQAVIDTITGDITVLTGGPGTGKTLTVKAILDILYDIAPQLDILCLAPTGKATRRMEEVTNRQAQTIHRLLSLKDDTDILKTEIKEKIYADLIIIDEFSMVDIFLFYKLISSIEPSSRVLIIGDYNQLPSVGPGNVLNDLIESKKINVVTLNEVQRQSEQSTINKNAYAIINRDIGNFNTTNKQNDSYFIQIDSEQHLERMTIKSIERLINSRRFNLEDIQILVPTKYGLLGTQNLNKVIQDTFNHNKEKIEINGNTFKLNDRVMQTVNNYDINIFNGETGIVTDLGTDSSGDRFIEVEYSEETVIYKEGMINELVLAYAITIHKSQGSEYKCVIIPIQRTTNKLSNNLLYTGYTRAKEVVVLLADKQHLDEIIMTEENKRYTHLKEQLINNL